MKGRIALIIDEDRALSTYPSVVNSLMLFQKAGYEIDLIVPNTMDIDCNTKNTRILKYKYRGFFPTRLINELININYILFLNKYNFIIPYHTRGLIATGLSSNIRKIPYGYFCLEIMPFDQNGTIKSKIIKRLENYFNKKANFTIVQDSSRKELIKKTNELDGSSVFCIPNSYIGSFNESSEYLREKFNIPKEKTIVLYSGSLEAWAIDENLIYSVDKWDENYILVLHGYGRDGYLDESLIPIVDKVNSKVKRIYLSLNLLDEKEYMQLISSADIGLAWYKRDLFENLSVIGLSSGKMSAYLRCGVPVIVPIYLNDLYKLAKEHGIGIAVNDEYGINRGISEIVNNLNFFKDNTVAYYNEYLDFEKKFNEVFSSNSIQML